MPSAHYFAKVFYASQDELAARIPELRPLTSRTIAVFGLGSLGAPSVLEFARAGVGELRLVDYDIVDPASTVRWPLGFKAAGLKKTEVLRKFISENYPYTKVAEHDRRVGVRRGNEKPEQVAIEEICADSDLIYDCTAEIGVSRFLGDYAWNREIPYMAVAGTLGGWGGSVVRVRKGRPKGCLRCYERGLLEDRYAEPPGLEDADEFRVQPVGCPDPTFTGAGFDMAAVALAGVRMAASTLCEGKEDAYPAASWDAIHIGFRDGSGSLVPPTHKPYNIAAYPDCSLCGSD